MLKGLFKTHLEDLLNTAQWTFFSSLRGFVLFTLTVTPGARHHASRVASSHKKMAEPQYTLYYHPIPFRGMLIQSLLDYKGVAYTLGMPMDLRKRELPAANFMAPPVLAVGGEDFFVSQTPAIISFLGRELNMAPAESKDVATADMIVGNCNDILNEITCQCGAQMWTQEGFDAFIADRFPRWLKVVENMAARAGLQSGSGYFFGGDSATYADTTLFGCFAQMRRSVPELEATLKKHMPLVMALVDRLAQNEDLEGLLQKKSPAPYCGGQIEKSLRQVVAGCSALSSATS